VAIRPFEPRDLDVVMSMVSETFQELFTSEMYLALQQAWPEGQLVDVEGGRLAGVLLSMKRSATIGRILVMAVGPGYRGMGLGSEMLKVFLRQCAMEGMASVVLEVRVSNLRAQSFYQGFGFHVTTPLVNYYPNGEDGLQMVRDVA
jgi:ribosomal protein S18 acetylase RimI-like enzyme